LSVDSNPSHLAWVYNIYQKTGTEIPFPIIDDSSKRIAMEYGMINNATSPVKTVRCVFIIDPRQIVRAVLTYPLTTGRCVPEIYRLLCALQVSDAKNVATPANWVPGYAVICPPPTTYQGLLERVANPCDLCCMDWYLCFDDPSKCP